VYDKLTLWYRSIARFLLTASVLALSLTGCATATKSRLPDRTTLTAKEVHAAVSENFQKLRTFEGNARVVIEMPGDGYNGFSKIYLKMPDSIYVKTEAILGIDIGALFLDERFFAAYAPRENTLYYGEAASLDLRDFLQVEVRTDELDELFTGLAQVETNDSSTVSVREDEVVLTTRTAGRRTRFWIDAHKGVVTKSEVSTPAGTVLLRKEFQRIRHKKGIYLPQTIKVTRPQARERITVFYTRQRINKSIKPERFRIKAAKNARKVYWGELEKPKLQRKSTND